MFKFSLGAKVKVCTSREDMEKLNGKVGHITSQTRTLKGTFAAVKFPGDYTMTFSENSLEGADIGTVKPS